MSDISNYAAGIDTTRLTVGTATAVANLVSAAQGASPANAMPLLQLLGEFASLATRSGL